MEGVGRGEAHRNILTAFRPFPALFLKSNKNALIIIINRTNGLLRVVINLHTQHDWIKNRHGITLLDVSVESCQKAFPEETRSTADMEELFCGLRPSTIENRESELSASAHVSAFLTENVVSSHLMLLLPQ